MGRLRTPLLVFALLVLVAAAAISVTRRASSSHPFLGVQWTQTEDGPVVVSVLEATPAADAGLRVGDRLETIAGVSARSVLDAAQLPWEATAVDGIGITVLRTGTPVELQVRSGSRPGADLHFYLVIVGIAFGASGLLIAARWPRVRGGVVYGWLAASMFALLSLGPSGRGDGIDWLFEWADLLATAVAPALLLAFGTAVTKRTVPYRRAVVGVAFGVSSVIFLLWVWASPLTLGNAYRFPRPVQVLELLDRAGYLWMAVAVVATTVLVLRSYVRSSSAMHRGQMRWLLWGLALGFGPFVLLYAVPWAMDAASPPRWAQFVAVIPMLFVPAAFTAAMARYRLYDVDWLLMRAVTEVAALLGTAAVYAATAFVLRQGVAEWIPLSRGGVRYFAFLVAAISYPQMRVWVRAGADRALYRQRYSYRATLLDWARELNAETDLPSLLESLRSRVKDTVGVDEALVLIRTGTWSFAAVEGDSPASLELDDASRETLERQACLTLDPGALPALPWARCLFSMRVKGKLRAVLAISGRAASDHPLTTEDRSLLATLSAHAATAIEAARLFREVRCRADEIERLHARQARILDYSSVGLALLDADWKILAWNRALEQLYCLDQASAVGMRLQDVLPLRVVRRIEEEVPAGGGETRIARLPMVNREGRRVVVNLSISRADAEEAEAGRRVLAVDDVTDQVQLEEQVLQQERLAALGLLAAGVAHEINTPLTGISSYAQLLLEDWPAKDPRREVLRKIEVQTDRASKIANSLLTLANPERTGYCAIDLNETIREALQLFEPQVRGRDVELHARLDPGAPTIRGHRGKLQQVLLNLLLNARDAVGESGTIELRSFRRGGRVVIEVEDDGSGIAAEDLPHIFDPFFTTKGRGRGTGLGLSISYGIVKEHEGDVRVESVPGKRTCFRIELPEAGPAHAMVR